MGTVCAGALGGQWWREVEEIVWILKIILRSQRPLTPERCISSHANKSASRQDDDEKEELPEDVVELARGVAAHAQLADDASDLLAALLGRELL